MLPKAPINQPLQDNENQFNLNLRKTNPSSDMQDATNPQNQDNFQFFQTSSIENQSISQTSFSNEAPPSLGNDFEQSQEEKFSSEKSSIQSQQQNSEEEKENNVAFKCNDNKVSFSFQVLKEGYSHQNVSNTNFLKDSAQSSQAAAPINPTNSTTNNSQQIKINSEADVIIKRNQSHGAFGQVSIIFSLQNQDFYVEKMPNQPENAQSFESQFLREFEVAQIIMEYQAKNQYKNLLKIYQINSDPKNMKLRMEHGYSDLKNFFNELESNNFIKSQIQSPYNLLFYFQYSLAKQVQLLSECNFFHGDIKLQNAIINKDQEIKLIDFNLTKIDIDINKEQLLNYRGSLPWPKRFLSNHPQQSKWRQYKVVPIIIDIYTCVLCIQQIQNKYFSSQNLQKVEDEIKILDRFQDHLLSCTSTQSLASCLLVYQKEFENCSNEVISYLSQVMPFFYPRMMDLDMLREMAYLNEIPEQVYKFAFQDIERLEKLKIKNSYTANLLMVIALKYQRSGEPEKAFQKTQEVLDILIHIKNQESTEEQNSEIINAHIHFIDLCLVLETKMRYLGVFNLALKFGQKANYLIDHIKQNIKYYQMRKANCLREIIDNELNIGQYDEAIEHSQQAISLLNECKSDNLSIILRSCFEGNIGSAYLGRAKIYLQNESEEKCNYLAKAKKYQLEKFRTMEKLQDHKLKVWSNFNLACVYDECGELESAQIHYEKALNLANKSYGRNHYWQFYIFLNIQFFYLSKLNNKTLVNESQLSQMIQILVGMVEKRKQMESKINKEGSQIGVQQIFELLGPIQVEITNDEEISDQKRKIQLNLYQLNELLKLVLEIWKIYNKREFAGSKESVNILDNTEEQSMLQNYFQKLEFKKQVELNSKDLEQFFYKYWDF